MSKKPAHFEIKAKELNLWLSNFRFRNPVNSEQDAILEMLRLKSVGPDKIKKLIADIVEQNIIYDDFIVFKENEKYIVYDGNRRLVAIKLFMDKNLNMIKSEFNNLYKYIKELKSNKIDLNEMDVTVKLYNDKEAMLNHIEKIHSGEQGGIGRISWGTIEKENFRRFQMGDNLRLSYKLVLKLSSIPKYKALNEKISSKKISTTIDRIFGFAGIKSRIFGLNRGEEISLDDELNFKKVCEMIEYFIENNGTVKNVYYKEDAENFFKIIQPIQRVSNNQTPVEHQDKNNTSEVETKNKEKEKEKEKSTNNVDNRNTNSNDSNNTTNKDDQPNNNIPFQNSTTSDIINTQNEEQYKNTKFKSPETKKYLTSAYKVNYYYKDNPRINKIKKELNNLEYKSFTISAMFLIRALLESYTHTYIDYFANLPNDNPLRMKGVPKNRSKRNKSLQKLLYEDIYNHLKNELKDYEETYEMIHTTLSDNNNTALTQIINHHIHSSKNFPDKKEVLNAWSKAYIIINTLDEILFEYKSKNSGQKEP
ncbi:hypothetical protein [Fervidibacillus albus]|uniref:ParB/Sulfiredoxin domain-containing protein n=1 Tax=Fervidibacillus albus TaxID=2980026 RepID=A0A9E8LWC2_9BACI|nr:hypothetical protein [Fervidibacillus albus]WAA10301.1 hypothetical protein OE104_02910 [Fervidibacillus albus]